ncbi:hypothetical protein N7541_008009 [Penicillium brevicompactum]|uniref:Uncharacterized protein n=1 Tax=Penicillium brevicompactum TaxID=5074 RepID=A0A9W9QY89_PENBR|nr:uncharacterized protein N7506_003285 [Penicillium brevicompactum]KAJ5343461.1 hypothetical protein N7506_003285 [Penicillium brevicompactum]KAJ5350282.1 hypothetical protein N7541_008009 [Penicillium brevicompactum]
MNCPSRTDDTLEHSGWNQNPRLFSPDTTTRNDFNGIANSKVHRMHVANTGGVGDDAMFIDHRLYSRERQDPGMENVPDGEVVAATSGSEPPSRASDSPRRPFQTILTSSTVYCAREVTNFVRFIGPGFLIAVAYIDPGNYATDVAAAAIIATDIAEVVGSAIALNLLLKIPLVAGCAITLTDVLFLLIFYRPNGSMMGLRLFELFVVALVLGVVVCFCIQLSLIRNQTVGEIFRGYLPSSSLVQGQSLYQSCGILGATVMPHSLFLGSGIVQSRLKEFDVNAGYVVSTVALGSDSSQVKYRPTIHAIRGCMKYSIIELILTLFTFALFVNSAILIVAGASLSDIANSSSADLFGIHTLLTQSIAPAAGLIFALALLLSGISAGIICTMAGQMVSEGMLNWSIRPWLRRLITRSISIIPSIIIAGAVGREGLTQTLSASQVVLSIILPFVSAPLIYFTCFNRYMTVRTEQSGERDNEVLVEEVPMRNPFFLSGVSVLAWLLLAVMNVALLVMVGLGES